MKCVLFFVLVLFSLALGNPIEDAANKRGCRYNLERCVEACPEGTHAYTTGCNFLMPEATCKNPHPVLDTRGMLCDFSACYCDAPTVRDENTKKCVAVHECSDTQSSSTKAISDVA